MKFIVIFALSLLGVGKAFAHGMSEADKAKIIEAGFQEYIELGATHMLTGYDHLLFLFGVVFFLTKFGDVVKFITAFTIGHSITLIFATLYGISANYFLVDAVIALTVCYKGFDNLDGFKNYLNMKAPNLLWMVFSFGLIHGFGLSTRLQQLPLPEDGLILRILAFNVGVEGGQVVALGVILLILSSWRKGASFQKFSKVSNVGLIILGGLLFLMQMHGYDHFTHSDDFPLNKDDHYHIHKELVEDKEALPLQGYKKRIKINPNLHSHGDAKAHSH